MGVLRDATVHQQILSLLTKLFVHIQYPECLRRTYPGSPQRSTTPMASNANARPKGADRLIFQQRFSTVARMQHHCAQISATAVSVPQKQTRRHS
jgi:hypothetical protein